MNKNALSILHVIIGYPPHIGGAEKQAKLIAENHAKFHHKVTVFTRHMEGCARNEIVNNVHIQRFFVKNFKLSQEIASILIAIKFFFNHKNFDVIQVHQGHFLAAIIAFVCFLLKKSCFIKIANSGKKFDLLILKNKWYGSLFLKLLLISKPSFISITKQIKTELQNFGIDTKKIYEIPNGVEVQKINSVNSIARLKKNNISFIGRIEPVKRPDLVVNLSTKFLNGINFNIYGGGTLLKHMKELCQSKKVNNCKVHGPVANISEVLSNTSVLILPSTTEGMSNSILEALAAGIPILATDIPQNRFLLGENSYTPAGILVKSESLEEWESALNSILDQKNYVRYSENTSKIVIDYDIKHTSSLYINTYGRKK